MAEKKINGKTFSVVSVLAVDSLVLKARIMQVLGGGISRLPDILSGFGEGKSEAEKTKSNSAVTAAFTDVFVNGDPARTAKLLQDIAEMSSIKTESGSWEKVDINRDFTGEDKALFQLVFFVLKEVFGDFLPDLLDNGMQLAPALAPV